MCDKSLTEAVRDFVVKTAKEDGKISMWTRELLGTDVYHLVSAFIVYSMLGWLVESIYMSFCNKKLTNRGFAKGPFCPIYGFGGVLGYLILHPLHNNLVALYLVGALLATAFEFLVGMLMIKALGELWWDYNDKPYNYKGIICLESTVAWGFYAVIIITFLHRKIIGFIDRYDLNLGIIACRIILFLVAVDYCVQLYKTLHVQIKAQREKLIDKYQTFKARWY